MDEAHVQHPVRLVQHEGFDPVQPHEALADQVHKPAGAGDHDLGSPVEGFRLRGLPDAAEQDAAVQLQPFSVQHEVFIGLQGQFPGRGEHQRADDPGVGLPGRRFREPLQDGQGEGGGFTGAGLGAAQDIPALEDQRDRRLLDRGRFPVACFLNIVK